MLSLRKHLIISGALFALMLAMAWGGSALQAAGVWRDAQRFQTPIKIVFFSIFIAFAFSLVPAMVKLFLFGQAAVGNAGKAPIRFVERHQGALVWVVWGIWIAGLLAALPAMMSAGFFGNPGGNGEDAIARKIAAMPVQGTLVAAPGMKVEQMLSGSTLQINRGSNPYVPNEHVYAGGAIFNFRVAGTGIEFPRCRYYFVTTYTHDPARIESINVGTASAKMTRAQLDAANTALRARLKGDGWLTGHEVYRDEEDRMLHGGRTRGDEGKLWLKNGIVLSIQERRMDDPAPGEDAATAGQWIQYVDLRSRGDYPWIERYEFAPPRN